MAATHSVNASSQTNLSIHHLLAACRFVARVGEIQLADVANQPQRWDELLQYALAAVMCLVASVESYANQLEMDWRDTPGAGPVPKSTLLSEGTAKVFKMLDEQLAVRGGGHLNLKAPATVDEAALIRLRNGIVHYVPEWSDAQGKHQSLSAQLSGKVTRHPYFADEGLFPKAWATHETVLWALRVTLIFVDEYSRSIGMCPFYKPWASQVEELSGIKLNSAA